MARCKKISVTRGSDHVDAEELIKSQLATMIGDAIRDRHLSQYVAAILMGIDQPKVSHVLRGRLRGYSTQRLIGFLTALGRDVDIVVRPRPRSRRRGRLRVGPTLSS
jgi:predicted XRE-type DNA-binding protein